MAATNKAAVANSLPDTFIAEVRMKTQEGPVMRKLVRNVDLPIHEGGQWEMTELTRVTAGALADGVDMSSAEAITDSTMQIVPIEYGAQVVVTDLAKNQFTKQGDLVRMVGQILGNSMITKEDIDLLVMLDGFSVALGSAGTSLTAGHIMAGGAAIRDGGQAAGATQAGVAEPAPDPVYGVFNNAMLHTVAKALVGGPTVGTTIGTSVGASGGADSPQSRALRKAYIGEIGDVEVYKDVNLSKDASDDAKGGVFSKESIVQVHFMGGPKMEPDRDPSARGTEYNIVMVKGLGEWKDAWGREMLFDAAAPTS